MKSQKWFTDRIGKKIQNITVNTKGIIKDKAHAQLLFKGQPQLTYEDIKEERKLTESQWIAVMKSRGLQLYNNKNVSLKLKAFHKMEAILVREMEREA